MANVFDLNAPAINRNAKEHHCFGCGALNEIGLQLEFRRTTDGVWAAFTPDRRYEGYAGMAHGGVLTTMLDEAMSWAITARGDFAVTARMTVSFRQPARIGALMRVEARVIGTRRQIVDAEAKIIEVDSGAIVAEAEGRFMRVTDSQAAEWRERYGDVGQA